ncbi:hypothetical protein K449DRAFT_420796 [Hypoxylon sp. EC38]|nr:hypothetical protein K449DRAFT_420796 [Hypoxylon sp. EC38]
MTQDLLCYLKDIRGSSVSQQYLRPSRTRNLIIASINTRDSPLLQPLRTSIAEDINTRGSTLLSRSDTLTTLFSTLLSRQHLSRSSLLLLGNHTPCTPTCLSIHLSLDTPVSRYTCLSIHLSLDTPVTMAAKTWSHVFKTYVNKTYLAIDLNASDVAAVTKE